MIGPKNSVLLALEPGARATSERFVRGALPLGHTFIRAEDMETAREMLREHLPQLRLVVIGLLLPKNPAAAEELTGLVAEREEAYDAWLEVQDRPSSDPDYQRTRFAVDVLDREFFELCDDLGGFKVIKAIVGEIGSAAGLPPVLYLTSREEISVRERALYAINRGYFLVIPVTAQEVAYAVKSLLEGQS